MNWTDVINGCFEAMASLFILLNCIKTYKDKEVKGVSIISTCFFLSWGFWNIYFYPANGHMFSFIAGIFVGVLNFVWVSQMIYYSKKAKRTKINDEVINQVENGIKNLISDPNVEMLFKNGEIK